MNLKFSLNRKSIAKKLTIVGKGLVLVMNPTKAAFRQCRVSSCPSSEKKLKETPSVSNWSCFR